MKRIIILSLLLLVCIAIVFNACQSQAELDYARYYVNGKGLYEAHCQNCHGEDGKGLGQLYPPLTDSLFLKRNCTELGCIIKNGLSGKIEINGQEFDGQMPAEPQMTNMEIAQLVTYITNSFGNKSGLYDVNAAAADIKNCDK